VIALSEEPRWDSGLLPLIFRSLYHFQPMFVRNRQALCFPICIALRLDYASYSQGGVRYLHGQR
jgi:hypothetical protein